MRHFRYSVFVLLLGTIGIFIVGCSTQKNTASSRWWHAFNAQYNTYYNGSLAYIEGSLEKENSHIDNFTELLPFYTVSSKASREVGKGNFERAIEKSKKAIKLHSIKKKPIWKSGKRKTARDREWLSRKEYNPFLWKAWMLMGRAQFFSGAFDEAASTFSYMSRIYQSQPAIYGKARAWLAKCYLEQGWLYDAEDVIRNMKRNSIHWQAQKEWDNTYADYYIHSKQYPKAILYVQKAIKHEKRKKQKARLWFLLGQLYEEVQQKQLAYKAYQHVLRQNPPYIVEFNARIAMSAVMATSQSKKMISKLHRMAANDNNKDYLEQIYYAIGNIYLNKKDTLKAIDAYEEGNKKATHLGIEKGVLLLKLGNLYWIKEKYADAKRCYGEAIGLLDKERDDYQLLSHRSEVLDQLVPYTDAVHLQDSLQVLAKMPENKRNAIIDGVITALKKKEKEEQKLMAMQNTGREEIEDFEDSFTQQHTMPKRTAMTKINQQGKDAWYFYNPIAVNQGKTAFQRLWGKRENVDNWQRVNKTVVAFEGQQELTDVQLDSIKKAEYKKDSLEQVLDSAQNNPHKRAYYLAQIPFTPEQVKESNQLIMDGLFHAGVIFKDKLDNLRLSKKALLRLVNNYPAYEHMDLAYYHLFLLYSRLHQPTIANNYVELLKKQYPKSEWTALLTNPHYQENAVRGAQIEDSLYAATYNAFKAERYAEVLVNTGISETRFPLGYNRDKFLFVGALSKLNKGETKQCIKDLHTLVEHFPESEISKLAGMIINGVQMGRQLYGGNLKIDDIWSNRSAVLNGNDTIVKRSFSNERNTNFVFLIAYHPDSINENQLLYRVAKYNFTRYVVRNFDVVIEKNAMGLHLMKIAGFLNFDEALQYARSFYQQKEIALLLTKARTLVISEENLKLLGVVYSYDDYHKYYNKHFAPLKISTLQLLTEPISAPTMPQQKRIIERVNQQFDDATYVGSEMEENKKNSATYILPIDGKTKMPQQGATVIPVKQDGKEKKKQETNKTKSIPKAKDKKKDKKNAEPKVEDVDDEYYDFDGF